MFRLLPLILLAAGPAAAACSSADTTFLWCRIEGSPKQLEVCAEPYGAVYRYGPQGRPELELVERYDTLDYRPWPGVGRDIWEEVAFYNGGYTYLVHGGVDRQYQGNNLANAMYGGVTVSQGGREIASLTCERPAIDFPYSNGLSDGKARAGLRWEPGVGWVY